MAKILGLMLSSDPRFRQSLQEEVRGRQGNIEFSAIAPGVIKVDRLEGNAELLADLQQRPPFFLRHLFPIHRVSRVTSASEAAEVATLVLPHCLGGQKVGVQCRVLAEDVAYRAVDVKQHLDLSIESRGGTPETKAPQYVVSVVIADKAYVGYSTPRDNLSRWNGGAAHYGAAKNSFSRAQHKLEEALEVFDIDLSTSRSALDLGAAPGGWSALLIKKGLMVTAVDTAELHPDLLREKSLTHLRQNAFDLRLKANSFDLLTCDMSWDPTRTARLLVDLARVLRPAGKVVLTIKFMGQSPLATVRECLAILGSAYHFRRGRHLWHNREELTLYLERR